MKRSPGFGIYLERAAVSDRHLLLLTLLVGSICGLLLAVGLRVSLPGTLLLTAALVALVMTMMLGQMRRPLLAVLAFTLPLHLDIYLGFYPRYTLTAPPDALGRIAANDVILVLLLFLWLGESMRNRHRDINLFPALSVPALLFIFFGLLSIPQALDPRLAIFQLLEWVRGLVLFLYLANCAQKDQDLQWILAGFMVAVMFESGLAVYESATGRSLGLTLLGEHTMVAQPSLGQRLTIRPTGTMYSTNELALYLGMTLPVIGAACLAPPNRAFKVVAPFVLLSGLAAVVLTLSRSTWLGLLASALLLTAFAVRKGTLHLRHVMIGIAGLTALTVGLDMITKGSIIKRLTLSDHGSAQSRLPLMRGALEVIADHPILGSGLNNYRDVIRLYDVTGAFTEYGILPVVHNLFLLLSAEIGIPGMACFVWWLAALARRGLSYLSRQPMSFRVAVAAGVLVGGLHMVIHNMVHVGLAGDPQSFFVLWFMAGLLVASTAVVSPTKHSPKHETIPLDQVQ